MSVKSWNVSVLVVVSAILCGSGCLSFSGDEPDLRFGVLSDVHLISPGDEKALVAAFTYFRDNGADAVVIAGDIANDGRLEQLVRCGACWRSVFPDDKAPDGRHVEKLFVYGNHDVLHWTYVADKSQISNATYRAQFIAPELRASAWEKAFGEKLEPVWLKRVKGYAFVGAHWFAMKDAPAFLAAHADELKGEKPFFYIQHAHPKDTCLGAWAWGRDGGASTQSLSSFSNAVAFSGHSHYALTDERTVWQGAFTSINTSSMRYSSTDYALRENILGNGHGYRGETRKKAMNQIDTSAGKQGMLVSVYGKKLVIERREFTTGKSLGPDWTLDIPGGPESSFAARAAKRSAPAFAPGAVPTVTNDAEKVTVSFPAARTVDGCRVYEYEVTATLFEDDVDLIQAQRRVMAPDFFLPETTNGVPGTCVFKGESLPCPGHYVFSVRPIECFGKKGDPINSKTVLVPAFKP